jgi:hypothetical protein
MGALKHHGRPKKELGALGEKGFHGRSSEYSELIIGDIRISGWRSLENNLAAREIPNCQEIQELISASKQPT